MRPVDVVEMGPARQSIGAVLRGGEGSGIGAFAQDGLDEAFGLAVGARRIGPGSQVFEPGIAAGGLEVSTDGSSARRRSASVSARTTPYGRLQMARHVEGGEPVAKVAADFCVSKQTVRK